MENTYEVSLNEQEKAYLALEVSNILREFSIISHNGRKFTNPIMANAFGKLFYSLTGTVHENLKAEYFNLMLEYHCQNLPEDSKKKFLELIKE